MFQLLSRIHSLFRYLNCDLACQWNQLMMCQAICLGAMDLSGFLWALCFLWCFFLCFLVGAMRFGLLCRPAIVKTLALSVTVLADPARFTTAAGAAGAAAAVADNPPPTAIAVTANAGALSARMSLVVTVRFSSRVEDKRGLSAGHALRRAQLHP